MDSRDVSLSELTEHVRDLRTALCGLCYALGQQPELDPDRLRTDFLEICLPQSNNQDTAAEELMILLAQSIARGKADSGPGQPGT